MNRVDPIDHPEPFRRAHARRAPYHINDAFQRTMMVGASPGIRLNNHGSGTELLRADAREIDGRRTLHTRCLRRVAVEPVAFNDAYARGGPILFELHLSAPTRYKWSLTIQAE